jgi:hypothetical protein
VARKAKQGSLNRCLIFQKKGVVQRSFLQSCKVIAKIENYYHQQKQIEKFFKPKETQP